MNFQILYSDTWIYIFWPIKHLADTSDTFIWNFKYKNCLLIILMSCHLSADVNNILFFAWKILLLLLTPWASLFTGHYYESHKHVLFTRILICVWNISIQNFRYFDKYILLSITIRLEVRCNTNINILRSLINIKWFAVSKRNELWNHKSLCNFFLMNEYPVYCKFRISSSITTYTVNGFGPLVS